MTPADKLLVAIAIFVVVIFVVIPMITSRNGRNRYDDDPWW